ncbi:MAG: T9SS type A sorting domain-containing protein [Ignavibacteriales bacterium]|nr:T9SS type A sorting domain-containing protein [Ignavibacteriales bacterium]
MKKIYILFSLLTVGLIIEANPIALPTIEISELYFDESDNWKLELGYYEVNQAGFPIDSIFIYTTTDTVKLPAYEFLGSTGVFVITLDSLDSDFIIKRYADTIKVVSYIMGEPFENILIFGNIAGSSINYPRHGQSISKYWNYYTKDNSPTIGHSNDTIGMCGTAKGIIYDKYSVPVKNRTFRLDYYFETSENGEYSARVYSKPSTFNQIDYKTGQYSTQYASITEISFIMEPDSVVELDIYLLDTLTTGINDINIANIPISVYPNPISKNGELIISIDLPIITSEISIEIIDLNGKMMMKKKINQNSSSIIVPDKSGFYIVRTMLDSQIISSNRIIVNE